MQNVLTKGRAAHKEEEAYSTDRLCGFSIPVEDETYRLLYGELLQIVGGGPVANQQVDLLRQEAEVGESDGRTGGCHDERRSELN